MHNQKCSCIPPPSSQSDAFNIQNPSLFSQDFSEIEHIPFLSLFSCTSNNFYIIPINRHSPRHHKSRRNRSFDVFNYPLRSPACFADLSTASPAYFFSVISCCQPPVYRYKTRRIRPRSLCSSWLRPEPQTRALHPAYFFSVISCCQPPVYKYKTRRIQLRSLFFFNIPAEFPAESAGTPGNHVPDCEPDTFRLIRTDKTVKHGILERIFQTPVILRNPDNLHHLTVCLPLTDLTETGLIITGCNNEIVIIMILPV